MKRLNVFLFLYLERKNKMIRSTLLKLTFIIGILSIGTACRDSKAVVDTLNRVETLLNEYPDSAYTLLQTLHRDDIHQRSNQARYALLYTQVQDKNYIDETNDSLIAVAVDYYRRSDDVRSKFLSFYYQGRVYTNAGESVKAMLAYTEAEQLADGVKDGYLLGLLCTQMGNIYRNNYDTSKSLAAYQNAEANYAQAGKELHRLYALLGQASVYRDMGELNDSYRLLQEVKSKAKAIGNAQLHSFCISNFMMLCVEMERIHEARNLYNELISQYTTDNKTAAFMSSVARLYATEGDKANALTALSQAWNRAETQADSIILHCDAAKVYELLHNPKEAYHHLELGVNLQNRTVRETLQQPIITIQRDYLSEKLNFQNYKIQMERRFQIVIVSFAAIVILYIFFLFARKLRRHYRKRLKEKLQKKEQDYEEELKRLKGTLIQKEQDVQQQIQSLDEAITGNALLRQRMDELKNEISRNQDALRKYMSESDNNRKDLMDEKTQLSTILEALFKDKINLIDSLILLLRIDYEDKNVMADKASHLTGQIYKKYCSKDKSYLAFEKMVNACYGDVMKKIRAEIKLPSEDYYRQICYHIAGFSVNAIALLMDENTAKLYKRRERIRDKILTTDTKNKKLFTKTICN